VTIPPGTKLGRYEIRSKLVEGGRGEVYLTQDTKLDRRVAIKFLNQEFSKDADKLNRFIQEAKAASALNHPNILTIHEIGELDGTNYIVTELIDGKTLREHLSQKETLQLNAILKFGVQVSEALSAAHQDGIIHRDIKPENIMLRKDGYAKVLDFGVAKLSEKKKLLASLFFVLAYFRQGPPADARALKLSLFPPENTSIDQIALSPDGRWLAFTAATGGKVST